MGIPRRESHKCIMRREREKKSEKIKRGNIITCTACGSDDLLKYSPINNGSKVLE